MTDAMLTRESRQPMRFTQPVGGIHVVDEHRRDRGAERGHGYGPDHERWVAASRAEHLAALARELSIAELQARMPEPPTVAALRRRMPPPRKD